MSCPEGYRISFWPAKAIGVPSKEVFLIPKKPEGESGVDYYWQMFYTHLLPQSLDARFSDFQATINNELDFR